MTRTTLTNTATALLTWLNRETAAEIEHAAHVAWMTHMAAQEAAILERIRTRPARPDYRAELAERERLTALYAYRVAGRGQAG